MKYCAAACVGIAMGLGSVIGASAAVSVGVQADDVTVPRGGGGTLHVVVYNPPPATSSGSLDLANFKFTLPMGGDVEFSGSSISYSGSVTGSGQLSPCNLVSKYEIDCSGVPWQPPATSTGIQLLVPVTVSDTAPLAETVSYDVAMTDPSTGGYQGSTAIINVGLPVAAPSIAPIGAVAAIGAVGVWVARRKRKARGVVSALTLVGESGPVT